MSQLIRWSLERLNQINPDLFSQFRTAVALYKDNGFGKPVTENIINMILDEYGPQAIAYPVTRMPDVIGRWAQSNEYLVMGLWDSTQQKYNMVENYDRQEESSDTVTDKGSVTNTGHTTGENSNTSQSTTNNSAYDGTVALVDRTDGNGSGKTEGTFNSAATSESNRGATRTSRIHGNIGVTTAAQMLEAERELHNYNVYKAIADTFAKDLLVGLYNF